MTMKKLTMVPALMVGLFLAGCSSDCVDNCEDGKDCDGASEEAKNVDCDQFCDDLDQLAADADCEDEWDKVNTCGAVTFCDSDECDDEINEFTGCIVIHCNEHPDQCEAIIGTDSAD